MAAETSIGLEILLIILAILWLTIWVITLLNAAKRGRYWWLALIALVQLILIAYWIVWAFNTPFRNAEKLERPQKKG